VYAALDRLTALGRIRTGSLSLRPFTRLECARLTAEAHALETEYGEDAEIEPLLSALDREFSPEARVLDGELNRGSVLEELYARSTGIAGTPLRDGFHFGQTLEDDFGRPYGQGGNVVSGLAGHAQAGAFAVYTRAEYQYASAIPGYRPQVQQAIATFDETSETWRTGGAPLPPNFDFNPASASRVRLIEGYVALNLDGWQLSAGQQSLWWGPSRSTSLILSNNAAAMPMLRLARVKPLQGPWVLRWLGPIHFDGFLARQGGIHFVSLGPDFLLTGNPNAALTPPPYLWGATLSLQPTRNFEFGVAHTVIFAGYGRPLNLATFLHTFSIYGNAQAVDPGKRVSQLSLAYRLPRLRNRLLFYTEAMAYDDPIQGHFTERFALDPGLYAPRLPHLRRADLRIEGVYTDLPGLQEPAYFYANAHYPQGYANDGQLLGSWIGRQGRGGVATGTYWFSPRNRLAGSYRKMTVDKALLEGGNLADLSASFTWLIGRHIEVASSQQLERWKFPLLSPTPKANFVTTFELHYFSRSKDESLRNLP